MLRPILAPCVLAVAIVASLVGCDSAVTSDEDVSVLSGAVVDAQTGAPVANAEVRIVELNKTLFTSGTGTFRTRLSIEAPGADVSIVVSKDGYAAATQAVRAAHGETVEVPAIPLARTGGTSGQSTGGASEGGASEGGAEVDSSEVSGPAVSLTLAPRSSASLAVSETGAQETAQLVFVARDADDRPVDLTNAVDLAVSILHGPGGGEFLSPAAPQTVRTDAQGEARVTLTSGTRAGVVQVECQATVDGRVIRSQPITLVIHGGFPDQDHFTVGTELNNYPGLESLNYEVGVSALLGDQFANPVQEGTQIYFTSDFGVIEGSSLTGPTGAADVRFFSGNPVPPDGWVTLEARTSGVGGKPVTMSTQFLLSGRPSIRLLTDGLGLGTYEYEVSDRNGNPLAQGTTISVTATGVNIKATGHVAESLGDEVTPGPLKTRFAFTVDIDDPEGETPSLDEIKIAVTGPNGVVTAKRPGNLRTAARVFN